MSFRKILQLHLLFHDANDMENFLCVDDAEHYPNGVLENYRNSSNEIYIYVLLHHL
jgi:hypothetical protein